MSTKKRGKGRGPSAKKRATFTVSCQVCGKKFPDDQALQNHKSWYGCPTLRKPQHRAVLLKGITYHPASNGEEP